MVNRFTEDLKLQQLKSELRRLQDEYAKMIRDLTLLKTALRQRGNAYKTNSKYLEMVRQQQELQIAINAKKQEVLSVQQQPQVVSRPQQQTASETYKAERRASNRDYMLYTAILRRCRKALGDEAMDRIIAEAREDVKRYNHSSTARMMAGNYNRYAGDDI